MTLATYISMPETFAIREKSFMLGYKQQINPVGSGFLQTIDRTVPLWGCEFKTPPLSDERYDIAITFLRSLQGSRNPFLAWDPRRIMPRAYQHLPAASDPWTQTGQTNPIITAMTPAASTIKLGQMQNGATISPGDYISYKVGNIWMLHVAMEQKVAASNEATVKVEPAPFIGLSGTPAVVYRRATAAFKMLGGFKEDDSVDSKPVLSFKAVQFIDRAVS